MPRPRRFDPMLLLDAAYRPAATDEIWLQGLVDAARPLDLGRGIAAQRFDLRGRPRLTPLVGDELPLPAADKELVARQRAETFRKIFSLGPLLRWTQVLAGVGTPDLLAAWQKAARRSAIAEVHGVIGFDRPHEGAQLLLAAPDQRPLPPRTSHVLTLIARHLGLGARLRRIGFRFDAVLDGTGRLVHAEGRARRKRIQAALKSAARRRAQGRNGSGGDALAVWREMVNGRWLLVQRHERDGRRYLLACRVGEEPPRLGCLTPIEKAVAGRAAAGAPNKQIAFELNLLPSVVAQYLAASLRKLGLSSRRELIVLHGPDGQDDGSAS